MDVLNQNLLSEYLVKGNEFCATGEYQKAIEMFDEVLKIDPKNIKALQCKGPVLNDLGKYQEAMENSSKALKIDPKNKIALNSKGRALRNLGKQQEAIRILDEALKIDPKFVHALNNKGTALEDLGKYQEAIELYDEVLKIDPEYIYALNNKERALRVFLANQQRGFATTDMLNQKLRDDSSATLDEFLENDPILKKLELNSEKKEALKTILGNKNTLVTARAGTGKSTLLCVLIYVLTRKYNVDKNNILLLSFNKSVREKNKKDLKDKLSVNDFFGTHTFDSLAYQIVKTPEKILNVLKETELIDDVANFIKNQSLTYRLKYWWHLNELDKEYKVNGEMHISFLGEGLKSYGEKCIANFLFEHGLDYEYESGILWDENPYRPDFLVTQGNLKVVVEYFGMTDIEYLLQAKRKRDFWKRRNDYQFIEMSIEDFRRERNSDKEFLGTLKTKLEGAGLTFKALSDNEKAEKIFQNEVSLKKIAKVTLDFINFAQAQCLSPDDISSRLEDENYDLIKKDRFFNEFANSVYVKFIENLNENNLYDFFRVKKSATKIILNTEGECSINLGPEKNIKIKIRDLEWVLIDEFQDYSPAYHELINAIKEVNPNIRFVCVGDDWQAIYGFAGSDIKYMSNYRAYFSSEDTTRVNLLTNFRSKKVIVDVGNNLMEGLGAKAVSENVDDAGCVWVHKMAIGEKKNSLIIQDYIDTVRSIISEYPNEKITILHRNNKIFGLTLDNFLIKLNRGMNRSNIKISNIHKYKGEENDILIFINVTKFNHPMIHPDRSKHYILGLTDKKIIDEERRLFYVAMTRAKKAVHILTDNENQSSFIDDLSYKLKSAK